MCKTAVVVYFTRSTYSPLYLYLHIVNGLDNKNHSTETLYLRCMDTGTVPVPGTIYIFVFEEAK